MINYDWIKKLDISKDELKSYCSNTSEVEFCWWVSGDIGSSKWTLDTLLQQIARAKAGQIESWRGNTHQIEFTEKTVDFREPIKGLKIEFTIDEFENMLKQWSNECLKAGLIFQ